MGRKGRCRDPEAMESTWVKAYELRRDGLSLSEIATEMSGEPHLCGGKSTAKRWVERGLSVEAAKGDPLRKHHARREMAVDALDATRVRMGVAAEAGQIDWATMFRLQILAIEKAARIGGYQAPPALPKVKDPKTGEKRAVVPADLFASLTGMSREELDAAIERRLDDMLPDERNQS